MRTLLLTALALMLAAPAAAPVTAAPSPAPASQCRAGEAVVYTCNFGKSAGSVCSGGGKLHYRYGPPGKPDIAIASTPDWSNVRRKVVVGGGGGSQPYLRFTRADYSYVVFWGTAGNLTERPGRLWSGIHVRRGDKDLATLSCRSGAHPVGRIPDAVPEDTDPGFDMWY
ncbi:hypothetical protein [Sphingomonas koreensis]|jgi:hypothetical protein|uniref:Secreted protein n=2 Tax=Sphingomonas koreensis TaxID=93064 RepID=A0AAJ4S549_9SPHN|nr:hypothetical protein [Sphingomonas koreensis]MDC7811169.1 hypothetical protein [Sphingomonas koreensis]PJI87582.1 hypothetical protein BDW16_0823 [Sphingomonas koreensis]RSV04085.1 hypothetical protein CA257_08405 [Sphingomonas koreensis]RSY40097.1 hypothetical protein DAH75_08650 [Sphingomonas koreensis]RSY52705.1 hypothetical protein DAH71_14095 [Sphingomonas koreensis]